MASATAKSERTTHAASSWSRATVVGIVAGAVAALVMGAVAMMAAATYQGTGMFTPLYHIGSAFGWGESAQAMGTSMEQAGAGDLFYFTAGPAAVGMLIHLMTGSAWGILFAWAIRGLDVARSAVVALGVAFGLAVMLVMAYLVLPALATLSGSGAPIRDMASMVGWGTFTLEHAVFGLILGLGVLSIVRRR